MLINCVTIVQLLPAVIVRACVVCVHVIGLYV